MGSAGAYLQLTWGKSREYTLDRSPIYYRAQTPFTVSFTPRGNLESPIDFNASFWTVDEARVRRQNLRTLRTCKLHIYPANNKQVTFLLWGNNTVLEKTYCRYLAIFYKNNGIWRIGSKKAETWGEKNVIFFHFRFFYALALIVFGNCITQMILQAALCTQRRPYFTIISSILKSC